MYTFSNLEPFLPGKTSSFIREITINAIKFNILLEHYLFLRTLASQASFTSSIPATTHPRGTGFGNPSCMPVNKFCLAVPFSSSEKLPKPKLTSTPQLYKEHPRNHQIIFASHMMFEGSTLLAQSLVIN